MLAPLHNPANADRHRAGRWRTSRDLPHVAVFDTAFFADLPPAASTYAIDRTRGREAQVRRYGFHGTSHSFVSHRVAEVLDRPVRRS